MGIVCFEIKAIAKDGQVICTSLWNSAEEHSTTETLYDDLEMVINQMRDIWNPARVVADITFDPRDQR